MSGKWIIRSDGKYVWWKRVDLSESIAKVFGWQLIEKDEPKILAAIAIAQLTDQTGWISYDS